MSRRLILLIAFAMYEVPIKSLNIMTHCACNQVATVIREGGSLSEFQYAWQDAWQTLFFAQVVEVGHEELLKGQVVQLAQEQLQKYRQQYAEISAAWPKRHYFTSLLALLSGCYGVAAVWGVIRYRISFVHTKAWYVLTIPKIIQLFHQNIGLASAYLQLAMGMTVAPYGIYRGLSQLYGGPAALKELETRCAHLEAIIAYLQSAPVKRAE